ncbi:MAG: hypothetical protein IKW39_06380 [Alphaproteobacteria bacterium]|nr:hypothetical protein [Alphaproteobacteria bacterium]
MDKIKTIIENYSIWGIFIGLITILIKPFISIRKSLRDMLITFIVSMLAGLLAECMDIPQPVKYGISGVCGLFGVRLYMILDTLLNEAESNPIHFLKNINNKEPH